MVSVPIPFDKAGADGLLDGFGLLSWAGFVDTEEVTGESPDSDGSADRSLKADAESLFGTDGSAELVTDNKADSDTDGVVSWVSAGLSTNMSFSEEEACMHVSSREDGCSSEADPDLKAEAEDVSEWLLDGIFPDGRSEEMAEASDDREGLLDGISSRAEPERPSEDGTCGCGNFGELV